MTAKKITLKKVLEKDEIISLIRSVDVKKDLWTDSDAVRKDLFRKVLKSGDRHDIINLIITICEKRKKPRKDWQKASSCGRARARRGTEKSYIRSLRMRSISKRQKNFAVYNERARIMLTKDVRTIIIKSKEKGRVCK
ncbi:MAG: hypothetical protein L6V93_14380 [Clostridiales bacterium]|nr:MAG: hypothetical protein L6V93_14380 [Clostridiales bacterium]